MTARVAAATHIPHVAPTMPAMGYVIMKHAWESENCAANTAGRLFSSDARRSSHAEGVRMRDVAAPRNNRRTPASPPVISDNDIASDMPVVRKSIFKRVVA